jgi:serine/threonine protein kinase/tetratricopeptide (TPR) repeat protein
MASGRSVDELVRRWQSLHQQGRTLTAEQLCAECPEAAPEVEERLRAVAEMMRFLDMPTGRRDESADTATCLRPAVDAAPDEAAPPLDRGLRHDRYQVGARLGEGGMGVVYRARDTREGRDVALKLVKGSLTGTARRRFEREFRSLSALRHPHCLGVYDYGELGGGPFFTMELFLGQPITSLAGRPLPERLEPLLQLTHALDYIHGHGIVHRDVKPSNILVRPATGEDGAHHFETRLMDFGLAKYYGVKSSLSAEAGFVGTVAYCAPEQLNLDELDHRADLYCMGLVAYEVLCGRYAFLEARLAGMRPLMQAQLNDKPRPLAEVNPEVAAPIADAVMKYLRKQPRRRPDSAGLLRSAIADLLGVDAQSMMSGVSIPHLRPTLSVTGFVCRTGEQETLDDVLRRCLRLTSSVGEVPAPVIVISGEPGIGKSSVVQEAERLARGHGCQVYEGRCFDGNLSPFQPFVEILRQFIAELRLQERREAEATDEDLTGTRVAGLPAESLVRLLAIVNDYRGELLRIAPELRKYLPGEEHPQADYARETDYIYRALAAFFLEIATFQAVCLSFEDLQWADKSSLDLLRHLAATLAAARRSADDPARVPRLVIVASARTGYPSLEGLLAQLGAQRHLLELRLAPLTEGETRELIALRLNCQSEELSDDLVVRVNALCGGNPFVVTETVREWLEKQAITRGEGGWELRTEAGDSTDLPETVRDVLRLRIQGLPPRAQQVLSAAAVVGAVVDIDLLRAIVPDLSETDILDAIDTLLPRRVFRETDNAGRVEFAHDVLREMVYGDLSAARRRALHRRAGEALERLCEQGSSVPAAALAGHFLLAGEGDKAFRYLVDAGAAASEAGAYGDALVHLNKAQACLPQASSPEIRYRLWELLGRANGAARQTARALECYREAAGLAPDGVSHAIALVGVGAMHQQKGELTEARTALGQALKETGCWQTTWLLDLARSLVGVALPVRRRAAAPSIDPQRFRIAIQANYELGGVATHAVDTIGASRAALRGLAMAKEASDPDDLALAYARFVLRFATHSGRLVGRILTRAERYTEDCRSPLSRAVALCSIGNACYFAGELDRAVELLCRVRPMLERHSPWQLYMALSCLRRSYTHLGQFENALAVSQAMTAVAEQTGSVLYKVGGIFGTATVLAHTGQYREAIARSGRLLALRPGDGSPFIRPVAVTTHGHVLLLASLYEDARKILEEAVAYLSGRLWFTDGVLPGYALQAESILGPKWAEPGRGVGRQELARARWLVRSSRRAGIVFPNLVPHALRVSARLAWARGDRGRAAALFHRAIDRAEAQCMRYELARSLLDASRVIPERADEYHHRGLRILDELGAVVPEAERFWAGQ